MSLSRIIHHSHSFTRLNKYKYHHIYFMNFVLYQMSKKVQIYVLIQEIDGNDVFMIFMT